MDKTNISLTLDKYIEENYPGIMEEYKNHLRKDTYPKIWSKVKWRDGSDTIYYVDRLCYKGDKDEDGTAWGRDYIQLVSVEEYEEMKDEEDYDYNYQLCKMENWWKELVIVKEA